MKKFYLLLFNLSLASMVWGQWTNDYNVNTLAAESQTNDIQSIGTNDGKTYIIFWDEDAGYDLRVQLIDENGYALFGSNGMLVNAVADNGTWTATRSNVVDADGNLYVGFTATNDGNGYVNKISPDGTQLYGENGIIIPDAWDLKLLALADGGVLVGWLGGANGMLMKYDATGTPVWDTAKTVGSGNSSLPFSAIGELALLSDGSFIVIVHGKATSWMIDSTVSAFRFDEDGDEIWSVSPISNQTLASNRRYPLLQDGDVVYLGYYGSTGFRFDSFLQRINPDGELPWGVDGADFSLNDTFYEMTTSIAFDENSDYIWSSSNICNNTQTEYGQYIQKFDKETGERLLGENAKEIFPVSAQNWIAVGDLQLVDDQPLFLFSNDISNGVNSIQLGVVFLDSEGDFKWEDEYLMIATSSGNKFRYDFTKNIDGQSVAIWAENREGGNYAFAQNILIEEETQSVVDLNKTKTTIYPNPSNGMVYVQSESIVVKIEVFDWNGKKILQKSNSKSVNLNSLPNGVYLIKTTLNDQSVKVNKLIKK
ncbi:MAG: T9SS type A sorting domain-containing protein [Weeksellaceae bacterium]|jgi:hypothetical protein|nr:T9SS type A sorting domain-containing protein [Weeksellaceae bacterium]MDX9704504.1 T9SS type A sorting domain-containing protein [Weeksellaceae bacterium]